MNSGRLIAPSIALAVVGLVAFARVADATPVIYTYQTGDVVITGISFDGMAVLAGGTSPEFGFANSSTATIDTQADTLAFLFNQSSAAFQAGLAGTYTGSGGTTYTLTGASVALSSIQLSQPTGTTLSLNPVGTGYTFAAPSGLTVSGAYDLENLGVTTKAGKTTSFTSGVTTFKPSNQPFSGSATLFQNGDTLQVDGLTLGTWTVDGQTVSVTGNIIFNGTAPVPVPASLWMLISGVGLLGFARAKRSG